MGSMRKPAVSGSFYPSGKEELLLVLRNFFGKARRVVPQGCKIRALVVPHAGYVYSGQTAAWGYAQLPKQKGLHFVLVGPSHEFPFEGLCVSQSFLWETPLEKSRQKVYQAEKSLVILNNSVHTSEHSLEVQLPFLQYRYGRDFSFSAFLTGIKVDREKAANYFLRWFGRSIFIFSSDLSHYLPKKEALKKDSRTIKAILRSDKKYFEDEENAACGAVGIGILLEMAKKENWKAKQIFSDTSATVSDDESAVVGYGAIVFYMNFNLQYRDRRGREGGES